MAEQLLTHVLLVMGTRPEVVKLTPVLRELQRRPDRFTCSVCVTGQHRELLDKALRDFAISPDEDLDVMTPDQSLASLTSLTLRGLDETIARRRPAAVIVQGDTTTALCGALAAFYRSTIVGHVEAGLRTGDKHAPFPEEANRRMISQLADLHFAPTVRAEALTQSGVPADRVFMTGNTVVDSLLWVRDRVLDETPPDITDLAARLGEGDVLLVTGHRRENFGPDLESICHALLDIADRLPHLEIVYPVHPNPNVREPVDRILRAHPRVHLLDALGYPQFVWIMNRATVILTDSGGVQEEAPSLGKPVLVTRQVTERPEGVEAGCSVLVGTDRDRITEAAVRLLGDPAARQGFVTSQNPYGDGRAAVRIADALETAL